MRIRSQCLTSSPPPSLQAEFKEAQAAAGSATSVPGGGADGGGPAAAAAAAAAPVEGPRPQVAFNRALVPAGAVVAAAQAGCPEGAVLAAAQDNDVPALEALRKAGGSAEEADEVRGEGSGVGFGGGKSVQDSLPPPLNPSLLQDGRTAFWWATYYGHLEALRSLLAAGANPAAANKVRKGKERRSGGCSGLWGR